MPGETQKNCLFVERLGKDRLIPVLQIERVQDVEPLGKALFDGGLGLVEVALRTNQSLEALAAMVNSNPDLIVGAGTLLDRKQVKEAKQAGAQFGVSPGFYPDVVQAARESKLPLIPGIATPSEAMAAMAAGYQLLKVFPAQALGGPTWLRALSGALRHRGVQWLPTGGIGPENIKEYLSVPQVLACGGTWLAPKDLVAQKDWQAIRERTTKALKLIAS